MMNERMSEQEILNAAKELDSELRDKIKDAKALTNERTLQLTNNLLTATTALLALLLAFLSSIMDSGLLLGKEWLFVIIMAAYAVSLIFWLKDYTTSLKFLQGYSDSLGVSRRKLRTMKIPSDFFEINREASNLVGNRSTKMPRIVQSAAFLFGTIALMIMIIWCVFDRPTTTEEGVKIYSSSEEFKEGGGKTVDES